MIQTSPTMRILVATQPVDFRKGIDGLAAVCRQHLQQDPMTGCVLVFRKRKGMAGFPPLPTRAVAEWFSLTRRSARAIRVPTARMARCTA